MEEIELKSWEERYDDVSRALLLVDGRVGLDVIVEECQGLTPLSFISPFHFKEFAYTARAAQIFRARLGGDIPVGVVIPPCGSRPARERFIRASQLEGYAPIVFHERLSFPTTERWLPFLEQSHSLGEGYWYHSAGWEGDVKTGRWTTSGPLVEALGRQFSDLQ